MMCFRFPVDDPAIGFVQVGTRSDLGGNVELGYVRHGQEYAVTMPMTVFLPRRTDQAGTVQYTNEQVGMITITWSLPHSSGRVTLPIPVVLTLTAELTHLAYEQRVREAMDAVFGTELSQD